MKLTLPLKVALLSVAACTTMVTEAQTIHVSDEAFIDKPVLPFAAPSQPVPGNRVVPVTSAVPVAVDTTAHQTSVRHIGEAVLSQASDAAAATSGVPSQQKTLQALVWSVAPADGTISATLSRWTSQAGYKVFWQAQKDLPATSATYKGTFEVALAALMADTRHSSYALHACLYDNKVVRVLHATQTCQQE